MLERPNYWNFVDIVPAKFSCYFILEEYTKSKGAGKGHKTMWKTEEMWQGAFTCYMNDIQETDRMAWIKTGFHIDYLDLRAEVIAGEKTIEQAREELKDLRDFYCGGIGDWWQPDPAKRKPTIHLPKSWAAVYLKGLKTREDWVGPRIKMKL